MKLSFAAWHPAINWATPAGRLLKRLVAALPAEYQFEITVFGSTPLQLGVEPRFLSGDVDIFSDDDFTDLIRECRLGKGQRRPYIEQTRPSVFRTTRDWQKRAFTTKMGNVIFCFPHPIDLLVAKLQRLEGKDLAAFKMVHAKTGFPKERDLIRALQDAVDLYRAPLPGERGAGDMFLNTQTVWRELFGEGIDVQKRIIQPVLAERAEAFGLNLPDWKGHLARLKPPRKRHRRGRKL
jgi:hypothetical protein